jgi:hypothetical protein
VVSGPSGDDLALLKLKRGATAADLKRAYRRAALELHPDQNPDPASAARFRAVTDAYRRLETQLAPAPRKVSLQERAVWFVADAQALLKRWPAERWSKPVDGLPAAVWLTSALEVLAKLWPETGPLPAGPSPAELSETLTAWLGWLTAHPLPSRLSREASRALDEALTSAEARLKALTRPKRSRS